MTRPAVPATFEWTEESWGLALRCLPLAGVAPHLFSTRQLQLSGPDDAHRLAGAVGAARVSMLKQVHGNQVVLRNGLEGDALMSDDPELAIAVRAADCVPLLIADRTRGVVAAVHAGWRGTAAKVAVAAVEAMGREFGTRPEDLIVAIGPSIGPCCYEVGSDLVDAFAAAGHERHLIQRWFATPPKPRGTFGRGHEGKLRLDVAGANRDQLVLAGVTEADIHMSGLCTAEHLEVLTSYRVENERAGRLIAAISPARPSREA
jgi:YfiH family protein